MEFKEKITITLTKDLLQWLENFQPNDLTNLITTFSNQAQLMGLIAESGMTSSKSS